MLSLSPIIGYMGLPFKTSQKLQLVQNVAAHMSTDFQCWKHIINVLKDQHWLLVNSKYNFKRGCYYINSFTALHLCSNGTTSS